ncbi:hypothetical protein HMPREF1214_04346 [Bacteroides sp. HPS0048]|nr:hypothetical protein HMPREF1214_04346 [Bacteroides sp. HPS0048]
MIIFCLNLDYSANGYKVYIAISDLLCSFLKQYYHDFCVLSR